MKIIISIFNIFQSFFHAPIYEYVRCMNNTG